jgi:hypothetical protein
MPLGASVAVVGQFISQESTLVEDTIRYSGCNHLDQGISHCIWNFYTTASLEGGDWGGGGFGDRGLITFLDAFA